MKNEFDEQLSQIEGLFLSRMFRYVECQRFQFGDEIATKTIKGEDATTTDWGIVVSSYWEITKNSISVTSSERLINRKRTKKSEQHFYDLISKNEIYVLSVQINTNYSMDIVLSSDYKIHISEHQIDDSNFARWKIEGREKILLPGELWRFMPRQNTAPVVHYVATSKGLVIDDE